MFNNVTSGNAICEIAEVKLKGVVFAKSAEIASITDIVACDVSVEVNGYTSVAVSKVRYSYEYTAVVKDMWVFFNNNLLVSNFIKTNLFFSQFLNILWI